MILFKVLRSSIRNIDFNLLSILENKQTNEYYLELNIIICA